MTETLTRVYDEIVVPVDFTSLGWRVLPTAEQLAERFGVRMRLLHIDTASPWSDEDSELLQLHATPLGRSVRVRVVPDRDVALGLGRAVAGHKALVAMSAHARPGAADLFVDSSLERILRTVDAPVVVCGPHAHHGEVPVSRIVLCVDADTPPIELLQDVSAWARQLSVPVDVLTVVPTGPEERLDEMRAQELRLTEIADGFTRDGVSASVIVIRGSRPAHEIVGYAGTVPGAVVALGTHARTAAARAIVGSVGMTVIRQSAGPVLLRRRDSHVHS